MHLDKNNSAEGGYWLVKSYGSEQSYDRAEARRKELAKNFNKQMQESKAEKQIDEADSQNHKTRSDYTIEFNKGKQWADRASEDFNALREKLSDVGINTMPDKVTVSHSNNENNRADARYSDSEQLARMDNLVNQQVARATTLSERVVMSDIYTSGVSIANNLAGVFKKSTTDTWDSASVLSSVSLFIQDTFNITQLSLDTWYPFDPQSLKKKAALKMVGVVGVGFGVVTPVVNAAHSIELALAALDGDHEYEEYFVADAIVSVSYAVLGVVEAGLQGLYSRGYFSAGASGARWASASAYVGKAFGMFGAVASAVRPIEWAMAEARQDRIDGLRESAQTRIKAAHKESMMMLADTLSEINSWQNAALGIDTGIGVVAGMAGLAAAPAALPLALAGAMGTLITSIAEHAAIEGVRNRLKSQLNNMVDKNTGKTGPSVLFERSLKNSFDEELNQHFKHATQMIREGAYDSVIAAGSVFESVYDRELAAISRVSHALNGGTFDGFLTGPGDKKHWDVRKLTIPEGFSGDRPTYNLPSRAAGEKSFMSFITPFDGPTKASTTQWRDGKVDYTALKVKTYQGWNIIDGAADTTFDLQNIVSIGLLTREETDKTVRYGMGFRQLPVYNSNFTHNFFTTVVSGGAGDDTFLMDETSGINTAAPGFNDSNRIRATIDGGNGFDEVNYKNVTQLTTGLRVKFDAASGRGVFEVEKILDPDIKVPTAVIKQEHYDVGKTRHYLDYRYVDHSEIKHVVTLNGHTNHMNVDRLLNIEKLVASPLSDSIDASFAPVGITIDGGKGHDTINVRTGQIALGGDGHDTFILSGADAHTGFTERLQDNKFFVHGGSGADTIKFAADTPWASLALQYGNYYFAAERTLKQNPDALEQITGGLTSRAAHLFAITHLAQLAAAEKNQFVGDSFLQFKSVEKAVWSFATAQSILSISVDAANKISLEEFDQVARSFLTFSGEERFRGMVILDASGRAVVNETIVSFTGNKESNGIIGTDGADDIYGAAGDDFLQGGLGVNSLTGGAGADTYVFNLKRAGGSYNVVNSAPPDPSSFSIDFRDETFRDIFIFEDTNISELQFSRGTASFDANNNWQFTDRINGSDVRISYANVSSGSKSSYAVINHFFTERYAGESGDGLDQLFLFGVGSDKVPLGYKQIVRLATKADRWKFTEQINLADVSTNADHWALMGTYDLAHAFEFVVGDFNGDGRDDFLRLWLGNHQNAQQALPAPINPAAFFISGIAPKNPTQRSQFSVEINRDLGDATDQVDWIFQPSDTNLIVGDFNGDGHDDFIRQEKSGWATDDNMTAQLFLNEGQGIASFDRKGELGALSRFNDSDLFKGQRCNIIVGDFNGDGVDDFIRQEKNDGISSVSMHVFFSVGGGRFVMGPDLKSVRGAANFFDGNFTNIIVGDFNGDGHDDFIRQEKGTWDDDQSWTTILFLNKADGSGEFNDVGNLRDHINWNGIGNDENTLREDWFKLSARDFNGDGFDDIFAQGKYHDHQVAPPRWVFLSTGGKFDRASYDYSTPPRILPQTTLLYGAYRTDYINMGHPHNDQLYFGDFNGDGASDVIRQGTGHNAFDNVASQSLLLSSRDTSLLTKINTEADNLIHNFSFETTGGGEGSLPNDWARAGVGGAWTKSAAGDARASEGNKFYALGGGSTVVGGHSVQQNVNGLEIGARYQLSFDYGVYSSVADVNTELSVQILRQHQAQSSPKDEEWFVVNSKKTTLMTPRAFEFTAKHDKLIVKFEDKGGYATDADIDLDNVKLQKISPPKTVNTVGPNFISNHSFETGGGDGAVPTSWSRQVGHGGAWTKSAAGEARASHENRFYALGGASNQVGGHSVEQWVSGLTPGAKYQLSFYYGVYSDVEDVATELSVQILKQGAYVYEDWAVVNSKRTESMTARTFEFIAQHSHLLVRFVDRGGYEGKTADIDLDNVELRLVAPEPESVHNLVRNGSFEAGSGSGGRLQAPEGWLVDGTAGGWNKNAIGGRRSDGEHAYALGAWGTTAGQKSSLRQFVEVNKGQRYELSFDLGSKNTTDTTLFSALGVKIIDQYTELNYKDFSVWIIGNSAMSTNYFSFIAPSNDIIIQFEDLGGNTAALDLDIDNVKLVANEFTALPNSRYYEPKGPTLSAPRALSSVVISDASGNINANSFIKSNSNLIVGDFNGDGYDDFIRQGDSTSKLSVNQKNSRFVDQDISDSLTQGNIELGRMQYQVIVGDFNGDGIDDFIRLNNTSAWVGQFDNKINNWSFEGGSTTGAATGKDSAPSAWEESGGGGGMQTFTGRRSDGQNGYTLGYGSADKHTSSLEQKRIAVDEGVHYVLSFDMMPYISPDANAGVRGGALSKMTVKIKHHMRDGSTVDEVVDFNTTGAEPMSGKAFTFKARGNNVDIGFSHTRDDAGVRAMDLDSVVLSKVPFRDHATVHVSKVDSDSGPIRHVLVDALGSLSGHEKDGNRFVRDGNVNIIVGDFNGDGFDDYIRQEKQSWDNDDDATAQLYLNRALGFADFGYAGELRDLVQFTYSDLVNDPMRGGNLIQNGGFEQPISSANWSVNRTSGQFSLNTAGVPSQLGVRVATGTHAYALGGYSAYLDLDGPRFHELSAQEQSSLNALGSDRLWQTVNLGANASYELSFSMGTFVSPSNSYVTSDFSTVHHLDPRFPTIASSFNVLVTDVSSGQVLLDQTIDTAFTDSKHMKAYSFHFRTAAAGQVKIEFSGDMALSIDFNEGNPRPFGWHQGDFDIDDVKLLRTSVDPFKGDKANIIVGDFNGDGYDDIIRQEKDDWDDDSAQTAILFLNNADGTGSFYRFGDLHKLTNAPESTFKGTNSHLIFEDFNGDGYADLLVDHFSGGPPQLYLSNGMVFLPDTDYGAIAHTNVDLIAGDWNGDGDADLISQGHNTGGATELYMFG